MQAFRLAGRVLNAASIAAVVHPLFAPHRLRVALDDGQASDIRRRELARTYRIKAAISKQECARQNGSKRNRRGESPTCSEFEAAYPDVRNDNEVAVPAHVRHRWT